MKAFKTVISLFLIVSMFGFFTVPAFAAEEDDEARFLEYARTLLPSSVGTNIYDPEEVKMTNIYFLNPPDERVARYGVCFALVDEKVIGEMTIAEYSVDNYSAAYVECSYPRVDQAIAENEPVAFAFAEGDIYLVSENDVKLLTTLPSAPNRISDPEARDLVGDTFTPIEILSLRDEEAHYRALHKAVNREKMTDEEIWRVVDFGGVKVLSAAETESFNRGNAVLSFGYNKEWVAEERGLSSAYDLTAVFTLYESAETAYTCEFSVLKDPVISAEEVKKAANLPQNTEITAIRISERTKHAARNYSSVIRKYSVVNTETSGWVECTHDKWNAEKEERKTVDRYYVQKDGSLATSSTTIDGVRYQFDKSGACQGTYTGFTSSAKGRRYWKDGTLVKNKWIRVKGERKYYAGADGYFVTGTATIDGEAYTFAEDGAVVN
ncbi:MAG: hypothetical protein NC084_03305 [Bacteroides sp.]|nr:hypothetical protein [Eubacterium sp.]MCM1417565.1 hypothetical protein [Roseburia sp.]MCM1461724.1 hypothetical protein [Bacteroides sp.]